MDIVSTLDVFLLARLDPEFTGRWPSEEARRSGAGQGTQLQPDDAKTKISLPIRLALKLILVTAQRPGEIAQANFNDIGVAQRLWRIGDNKSERPYTVPLTDLAIELIEELRRLSNGRPHLLPSVHSLRSPHGAEIAGSGWTIDAFIDSLSAPCRFRGSSDNQPRTWS